MIPQKIVLAPDSFKGSLSANDFCLIATAVIGHYFPTCRVMALPLADGGEGSVDCFLTALGGEQRFVNVQGPLGEPLAAFYALLSTGQAVVEMAAAAGLPLLQGRLDVESSYTFGVGQLMRAALNAGARKLIVGLGGSCTNDAGCGAAAALGVRFYNRVGKDFIPCGGSLSEITAIDLSARDARLDDCELQLMCDIANPMYGPTGAAYVFAPQKGADAATVERLDAGLRHLAALIQRDLGLDVSQLPGGGAAGGMGAGLTAFCGGQLQSGIELVLDTVGFDAAIRDADLIITGEGCLDSQSVGGKVVAGVCGRARAMHKPVIALAGAIKPGFEPAYGLGLSAALSITPGPAALTELLENGKKNLAQALDNLCRLLSLA